MKMKKSEEMESDVEAEEGRGIIMRYARQEP